ncbi:NAD(P)-dependent oxidoreductase [Methylobacterium sp. NEAU K]|uniref:NAD-dependent epimerase/dehydratase family protein n=1 Tax=Methylobacterium sp. NEAU K TaxID=3064946 RepID=UPI002732FDBF|nr:NAD(P)-dependent oxidoreductase [Methylobacterium sp. NEAU K]MDP4006133.1 NAD(P)-dependent oxidoreductase [Methylobacterium sp. NEAU K]
MSGPVLVTGAGGFIGRAVVARLTRAGIPVRAGLRRPAPLAIAGVASTRCDLSAPAEIEAACAGAAMIVHAAGRETATMVAQLRALLDAAGRAGVERFVLFSSIAVYGTRTGHVREDDPPGDLDTYGAAKRTCEALLQAWIAAGVGRRAVILRPGIVYGPGSDLWIARPAAALRAGVLGDLGRGGEGIAALIHLDDVAEATRAAVVALQGPGPAATALNLVGPESPTWNAYFAALSLKVGLGLPRRIGRIRLAVLRALAVPAKLLGRLGLPAPTALRLVPAAGEIRLFARAAQYDTRRAVAVLGVRPAIGLDRGLDALGEVR